MNSLIQDIRYAFRQLIKNPGFATSAILCLALGIGANTAIFSFANTFLRPKPMVREPERIVRLFVEWSSGLKFGSFSHPDYLDFRKESETLEDLAVENVQAFHLSTGETNERIAGSIVSGNYFDLLGVTPARGRAFAPEEDRTPGTHPVTVISHGLWQRRFGGDQRIIGRTLLLSGNRFTIIGVMPEGFTGANQAVSPDLWVPAMMQEQAFPGRSRLENRGDHWLNFVIGRLKPGVTVEQARIDLNARAGRLAELYPETNEGQSVVVYPESEASLHPSMRGAFVNFMALLFFVVGAILLLACGNVAGLLLARYAGRRREIGVRQALGAGRARLIRQLLIESLVLSILAGIAGFGLGIWLINLIKSIPMPPNMPISFQIETDYRVLFFTVGVSILTGIVFGLAPAFEATRQNLVSALKETASSGSRSRLRNGLVVGQIALSLILLIAAGLVIQSLRNVRNLDPGFNPDNQVVATIDAALQGYDQTRSKNFFRQLVERLEGLPGIEAVGLSRGLPMSLNSRQRAVLPEGYQIPAGSKEPDIDYNFVDNGYFRAMGIPILRGRAFTTADTETSQPVIVVNAMFAERFWPGQEPVGRRVRTGGHDHLVIGVVGTGKYFSLGEDPKPFFYVSLDQDFRADSILHVRSQADLEAVFAAIQREVRALDPTMPVSDMQSMHSALGFALLPARMAAGAVSTFAGLALLLAAVGLYGVIAFSVKQSLRDLAIRTALGARPLDLLKLQLGRGMRLVTTGIAIGLVAAITLSRFLTAILYGVSTSNPMLFIIPSILLVAVTMTAIFLPARRAMHVDPIATLRDE